MSTKEWPTFQGNPARTGETQDIIIPPLKKVWEFDHWIQSAPAICNGLIFFGNGSFFALEASSGRLAWKFVTKGAIHSSPTVNNGMVYFGSNDRNFYALDIKNGEQIWKFRCVIDENDELSGLFNSSPLIIDNVVCISDDDLYLLNAKNGNEIARGGEYSEWTGSNPAFCYGILYAGYYKDVRAYDWTSKQKIWSITPGGRISSGPSVCKNIVYVGTSRNKLHAIQAKTGQPLWEFQIENKLLTSEWIRSSPAISQGRVFFGAPDGWVYALNADDGKKIWSFDTGSPISSSPVISGSVIYIISECGIFFALDAEKGQSLWTYNCQGANGSSPAICNNMVYVAGKNKMYAFSE